jgi:hypothetical protein
VPQSRHEPAKLLQGAPGGGQRPGRAVGLSGAGGTAAAWGEEAVPYSGAGTGRCRGKDRAGPGF